ncbi:MAG: hypothetical protein U9P00_01440 [Pseudomonadota bacterium]|nr:hypothetical protein [Pseudomonadota bacterium]
MARVECTNNDASFFKIHRWVEQRDGWTQWKLAPLRKNIYRLRDLRKLMRAANERYLAYMAAIDNPDADLKDIDKMSGPAKDQGRSFRGVNLFQDRDYRLFLALGRGEWSISGFRAADLRTDARSIPQPVFLSTQASTYPRADQEDWSSLQIIPSRSLAAESWPYRSKFVNMSLIPTLGAHTA